MAVVSGRRHFIGEGTNINHCSSLYVVALACYQVILYKGVALQIYLYGLLHCNTEAF